MLKIFNKEKMIGSCSSAILVPEKALEEAGYIITMTDKNNASSKHEFHAMAQMAYFQYQDDELELQEITGPLKIESEERDECVNTGLVLYRDADGGFHAIVHDGLNKKKLLEAAYRFCTRWVRLDI
jgi:hypothetical protein